ncbi:MAG: DUF2341 domain-containing protein [Myxococcota bacterium]
MRAATFRTAVASAAGVCLGALFAACGPGGEFNCRNDAQCSRRRDAGTCEPSGVCSFPDASCPSGRRYANHSGELSEHCVPIYGEDPMWVGTGEETAGQAEGEGTSTGAPLPADTSTDSGPLGECVWWDNAWGMRTRVAPTVSTGESLADFVVLVQLHPDRFDYSRARIDGADLRFVDADDQLLPHEIERWDPTGTSLIWVRLSELSGFDDEFWMYYDNPEAAVAFEPSEVWPEPYAMIGHMHPPLHDACGLNTLADHESDAAQGPLGEARGFAQDDDYVSAGSEAAIDDLFATGGTASAWILADDWGGSDWGRVFDKSDGVNVDRGWAFMVTGSFGGTLEFRKDLGPTVVWRGPDAALSLGQWHFVAVTFDDGNVEADPQLYLDGLPIALNRENTPNENAIESDAANDLWIGNRVSLSDRQFEGIIDEVRLTRSVRSPAWIEMQHRSMTDTLLEYDAPQPRPDECEQAG